MVCQVSSRLLQVGFDNNSLYNNNRGQLLQRIEFPQCYIVETFYADPSTFPHCINQLSDTTHEAVADPGFSKWGGRCYIVETFYADPSTFPHCINQLSDTTHEVIFAVYCR